ncbi:MAG: FAD-dependent oxidoreductase [Gemmatimonadota bacterium]|nr:MAG: FAD-dependent oxidoreductase [Gemmatimonadota bacterium]
MRDIFRIEKHPILTVTSAKRISFTFNGKKLYAHKGEVITSALFANGIRIFGHHPKDSSPQGMFCANGQCAQCTVIANGVPVKGCMIRVEEEMSLQSCDGLPELPEVRAFSDTFAQHGEVETEVLIIGGGPAGIAAAIELGKAGLDVLIVDDKHRLGGKLVLQTHSFFGTVEDVYAGTRGIDIATRLTEEVGRFPHASVSLNTQAVGVFSDGKIGLVRGEEYFLTVPKAILIASGAREKGLLFPGCDLPGVYGAGAFQTLVNRDLVRSSEKLFIVGGGNVGLIAGYHALQAGIDVVGLVEVMDKVGGYKVHADKLKRHGVPIHTSHTVLGAGGDGRLERVTIARVDASFNPIQGTERTFAADTLLIAVGLDPIDELYLQAERMGMRVYSAGDSQEIAEASAAIFSGRIAGRHIARDLEKGEPVPEEWSQKAEILKSKPGETFPLKAKSFPSGLFPVIFCHQEIPCDPCTKICPKDMIVIPGDGIMSIPEIHKDECTGCYRCVAFCPGLAITLVDLRQEGDSGLVTVPFELSEDLIKVGDEVDAMEIEGRVLTTVKVEKVIQRRAYDRTLLVVLRVPKEIATSVAGFKRKEVVPYGALGEGYQTKIGDETVVCRCERVTAGEIRRLIREGVRDMNQLKVLRCGMGACGGKTCEPLILSLYKQEGIDEKEVFPYTKRPLLAEVPLNVLAGLKEE